MSVLVDDDRFVVEATMVVVSDDTLTVHLEDGRSISVPLVWYPRLLHGTPRERKNFEIGAFGIHWPDLNEDISIRGLLLGQKSGESLKSIKRWLTYRARGEKEPIPTFPLPDWFKDGKHSSRARRRRPKTGRSASLRKASSKR